MTKGSYQNWLTLALLTLGHFFSDFYNTFLPVLLPAATIKLGLSMTAAGSLIMVYSFTSSILQPILGYYIDRYGWTWLILLTVPASALFICLAGMSTNFWQLFICILLAGLASSLFHPLGSAMLNQASEEKTKGTAMALFIGGGNLGVAIAPAVVLAYILYFGTDQLLWLAVPGLVLGLAYYVAKVHHIPAKQSLAPAAASGPPWYKSTDLLKLNLVMGLRSWPQAAIPNFLVLWLAGQGHAASLAGGMLTVFLLGGALGSVGGGYAGDRMGRKTCIMVSLALCIPALYLFLTIHEITLLTYILLFVGGAALQGTLPSSIVWAQELLPANAAMASGMMLGLSFGLGGLGAAITGAMADITGLQTALLWSLVPLIVAIGLTWSIPEKQPPTTQTMTTNS